MQYHMQKSQLEEKRIFFKVAYFFGLFVIALIEFLHLKNKPVNQSFAFLVLLTSCGMTCA